MEWGNTYPLGAQYMPLRGEGNFAGMAEQLGVAAAHAAKLEKLKILNNICSENSKRREKLIVYISKYVRERPGCQEEDILKYAIPPDISARKGTIGKVMKRLVEQGTLSIKLLYGAGYRKAYFLTGGDNGPSED